MKAVVSRASALAAAFAAALLGAAPAAGVTMSIAPNPATAGTEATVAAAIQWSTLPTGGEAAVFDFGDGGSRTVRMSASICNAANLCRPAVRHTWTTPGRYTVRVEAVGSPVGGASPAPPNPVRTTLVVNPTGTEPPPPPPPPPPVEPPRLSAAPASHAVPFGEESLRRVTWSVRGDPALGAALVSPGGRFVAGGDTIGTGGGTLSLGVAGGAGSAAETVRVPVAVVEAVLARRLARFTWERAFHAPDLDLAGSVEFAVTGRGAADFRITRIELRFENREAQITVPRGREGLRAAAVVGFTGAGLLAGRWEVDGRAVGDVSRHLSGGGPATIESPATPALPTFDPGSHTVRFVPLSPAAPLPLPEMVYVVTPEEAPVAIELIAPPAGARLEAGPRRFAWSGAGAGSVFLVEFFEDPAGAPVFSAWTREARYDLPPLVAGGVFGAGKRYFWKVTGHDDGGIRRGASPARAFFF